MVGYIEAKRIKPKTNRCDCCLNKRAKESKALVELCFCNEGCRFIITLCDACLADSQNIILKAIKSKGQSHKSEWEGEV